MKLFKNLYFLGLLLTAILTTSFLFLQPSSTNDYKVIDSDLDSYTVVKNIKLRYQKTGSGLPILLLHHVRGQLEYFDKIVPLLNDDYTVYVLDLPNHGKSDIADTPQTAQFTLGVVKEFIQTMGLDNAYLVGESIGGSLVLSLAADQDLKITKVIALNPFDGVNGISEGSFIAKRYIKALDSRILGPKVAKKSNRWVTKKVLQGGFYESSNLDDQLIDLYVNTGRRDGYGVAFRSFILNRSSYSRLKEAFVNITASTLIIHGESDWSPSKTSGSYGSEIKNATYQTIEECGHFSSQEKPEEVAKYIRDFLTQSKGTITTTYGDHQSR